MCQTSKKKREVYNSTNLPQETRKTSSKQPNLTPKATRGRRINNFKVSTRKEIIKIRAEISAIETLKNISDTKTWFFKKMEKIDKPLGKASNQ